VSFDSLAPARLALQANLRLLHLALPKRSIVVKSSAFTLLEVLVATAVLALMMTFLFNLLGSSAKLWEIGNKKIEAAQAARMGLNIMANELKNAFAGNMTTYSTNGSSTFNVAPFLATPNPTFGGSPTLSSVCGALNAEGSQRLSFVSVTGNTTTPYREVQYQSIYLKLPYDELVGNRYCLVRGIQGGGNFYFRGSVNTTWEAGGSSFGFESILENCIRLKLQYYGNESSPTGTPAWTNNGSWTPQDRLPLGVLVTLTVLDSKTAEKIAAIKGNSPLTAPEITNGLSSSSPATLTPAERLISQGSVTMSRFIPFNSN
jgi:prepilin-type N-terminal cleavage/methylation domain-containing protein